MKVYPKDHEEIVTEKPEKDTFFARQLALILAFISAYGFAIKLIFF